MSGEKLPWGPSCDRELEDDFGGSVTCREMKIWLKDIKVHLQKITSELDRVIDNWGSICGGPKDEVPLSAYDKHIREIERMVFNFPRCNDHKDTRQT